jgi:uncharacterized protein (TIGR03067 family)
VRIFTVMLVASLFVLSGCSNGGPLSTYSPEEDAKKMQGTWTLTGATFNGERMTEQAIGQTHLTIEGDRYTMTHNGTDESSTLTLGIGGPHSIRVFHHENPLASQGFYGGTLTGIYELSGDRLRICFDLTGRQYPKTFDASKGSQRGINEFVLEKSR